MKPLVGWRGLPWAVELDLGYGGSWVRDLSVDTLEIEKMYAINLGMDKKVLDISHARKLN